MEVSLEDFVRTAQFAAIPRVRVTCGETLENGQILDLVAAADRDGLDLLCWDGEKEPVIQPAFACDSIVYQPPDVHPSVREAMTFPKGVSKFGTSLDLFTGVATAYREHMGLPEDLAAWTTSFTFASWVPEFMLIPPTLCLSGAPLRQTYNLFRFSGSLCRRALLVAELSRRLPFFLRPTLMVNDPKLSARACAAWSAANCQSLFVAGSGSTVCSLSCPKAVVLQPGDSPQAWGEEAMFLMLPHSEFAPVSNRMLADITAEFQPKFEMWRLRLLSGKDQFVSTSHPLARFGLARTLGACIPEDPRIVEVLTPLLESHQQDLLAQRSRDPKVGIVEAIWVPAHRPGKMSTTEISERVNALLASRGEIRQYSSWEIGWMLKKLRLHTRRSRDHKALEFSSEIRQRVHQLAREFELQLPQMSDCTDCKAGK
jgi:hypothetical protein